MTEWIVSSSVLIFIMILLRALLRGRISPRLQYALWLMVLLRLLVPVSPFVSSLSVTGLVETASGARAVVQVLPEAADEEPVFSSPSELPAHRAEDASTGSFAAHQGRSLSSLPPAALLWVLWLAGALTLLLFAAFSNYSLGRRLRRGARPLPGKWTVPPRRIYISPAPGTPCLFGLLSPAIFVSEAIALDDRALGHVLSHERAHFRQGDPVWSALRVLVLALHWYNPLVWWACVLSKRDAEAAADAAAIVALGEKERLDYGRTLIGLVARTSRPMDLLACGTTMSGAKRTIRQRVKLLAKKPRTTLPALVLAVLICALAVRLTYTGPGREKSPDRGSGFADSADPEAGDTRSVPGLMLSGGAEEDAPPASAPTGVFSDEESFIAAITETLTANGYTPLTGEDYAAEYPFALVSLADAPEEFKKLGLVFVKPNPGMPELTMICQVLYSYERKISIQIHQDDIPDGTPSQGFFTYSNRDLAGRPYSEGHPWASWWASYQPPTDGSRTLYFLLLSAQDLGEAYCRDVLTAIG